MEIIKTGANGIMISLTGSDYNTVISPEGEIDAVTARNIALQALAHTGIECTDSEFILDAFFGRDSCLLFAAKRTAAPSVFYKFRSLNDVCSCARALPPQTKSSLYYCSNRFFLLFDGCEPSVARTLSEYGQAISDPDIAGLLDTQGKLLCQDNAVEILKKI